MCVLGFILFYGVFFVVILWFIMYLVEMIGWYLVILLVIVCFMLVGLFLVVGFYDVSWEMEKGYKFMLCYFLCVMCRNVFNEWGFVILFMVMMIFWLCVVLLIYVFYLFYIENDLESLLLFLVLGIIVGVGFILVMFFIMVFI